MTTATRPASIIVPDEVSRSRPRDHVRPAPERKRRGANVTPAVVATGIVLVALFLLAVAHALLITGQRSLDAMRRDVAAETEEIRILRLAVAEREAPDHVLTEARQRLGMVTPPSVGYLLPIDAIDGADVDKLRVDPAEKPPPPPVTAAPAPRSPAAVAVADGGSAAGPDRSDGDEVDATEAPQSSQPPASAPSSTNTFDVGDGAEGEDTDA